MKKELRKLWKNTFGDTDAYLDLFFGRVYKEENVLYLENKGKIVSALHLVPYEMTFENEIIPISYICGVATIPEERGKGYMATLMQQAHELLRQRGDIYAVLIPATPSLFSYYRQMGYREFFSYEEDCYSFEAGKDFPFPEKYMFNDTIEEAILFNFFDQYIRKRAYCILHNYPDFQTIRQEMYLAGGELKVLTTLNNEIRAMAFIYPQDNTEKILIKEIIYIDPTDKHSLLSLLCKENRQTKYIIRQPVTTGIAHPFGMAYPLNSNERYTIYNQHGFMSLMLE